MKIEFTARADKQYRSLEARVQRAAKKQLELLRSNLRHPSLDAKKYDESRDIWQGRVNYSYRFYFQIKADTYLILSIIPHPK